MRRRDTARCEWASTSSASACSAALTSGHGLKAFLGSLPQTPRDDSSEGRRGTRGRRAGGFGFSLQHGCQDRGVGTTGKGALPRDYLVQHRPEAEDVAARVGRLGLGPLRRHAGDRPHRERFIRTGDLLLRGSALRRHREKAEVDHFDLPGPADHDVAGLEVAVNDAGRVRLR